MSKIIVRSKINAQILAQNSKFSDYRIFVNSILGLRFPRFFCHLESLAQKSQYALRTHWKILTVDYFSLSLWTRKAMQCKLLTQEKTRVHLCMWQCDTIEFQLPLNWDQSYSRLLNACFLYQWNKIIPPSPLGWTWFDSYYSMVQLVRLIGLVWSGDVHDYPLFHADLASWNVLCRTPLILMSQSKTPVSPIFLCWYDQTGTSLTRFGGLFPSATLLVICPVEVMLFYFCFTGLSSWCACI